MGDVSVNGGRITMVVFLYILSCIGLVLALSSVAFNGLASIVYFVFGASLAFVSLVSASIIKVLKQIRDALVSKPMKPSRIQQTEAHPAATAVPTEPAVKHWTCRSCGYDKNTSMAKECKSCGKAR